MKEAKKDEILRKSKIPNPKIMIRPAPISINEEVPSPLMISEMKNLSDMKAGD